MIPFISLTILWTGLIKLRKITTRHTKHSLILQKPIVVIDPINTLVKYKWSFWRLSNIFYKRLFTEEFLINLGMKYDILFVTNSNLLDNKIYKFIDPLNISRYRIYTKNMEDEIRRIRKTNQRVICLSDTQAEDDITLNIGSFNINTKDSIVNKKNLFHNNLIHNNNLLDVVDFLNNLNIQTYTKILPWYKNKDFYKTYNRIQKKIFIMKNMLNPFCRLKYEDIKTKIFIEKIKIYEYIKGEILSGRLN